MSHLKYFTYEGFGERAADEANSSQAVRVGDMIEISGQGGWNRITDEYAADVAGEVEQAFANVEHTLQRAGGTGWEQVYKLRMYCAPLDDAIIAPILANMKKTFPHHKPILTVVGVPNLAYPQMHIEIEAVAHLRK